MRRFICEQNAAHFQRLLNEDPSPVQRLTLEKLLASARRELALLNSETRGADNLPQMLMLKRRLYGPEKIRQHVEVEFQNSPHPYMLIDPGPGLRIVDINEAYAAATFVRKEDIVGRSLFDAFPDNPALPNANGVDNLYQSLTTAARTGQPHSMTVQRYDIRKPDGEFVERYWQPINIPVHDREGHLIGLLHHVEDVTEDVLACLARDDQG